jgi:hypothetical protein
MTEGLTATELAWIDDQAAKHNWNRADQIHAMLAYAQKEMPPSYAKTEYHGKTYPIRWEPVIHSHVTDVLPEEHPLAYDSVHCTDCQTLLHYVNNECMTTWVEAANGPRCLNCFAKLVRDNGDVIPYDWGLEHEPRLVAS